MFKHFVVRGIVALVLIVALAAGAAGIGRLAYTAGMARGLAESGKPAAPEAGIAPYASPFYPHPGSPFHRIGFFGPGLGLLNCLLLLLGLGFIFALVRGLFWHRMFRHRAWGGPRGPFGPHTDWAKGYPPMFEEWHRRAHGESAPATPPPPESAQA